MYPNLRARMALGNEFGFNLRRLHALRDATLPLYTDRFKPGLEGHAVRSADLTRPTGLSDRGQNVFASDVGLHSGHIQWGVRSLDRF